VRLLLTSFADPGQPRVGEPAARRWSVQPVDEVGVPSAPATDGADLISIVAAAEAEGARSGAAPRWVWASTAEIYPRLVRAGIRVSRCHDVWMTQTLLDSHDSNGSTDALAFEPTGIGAVGIGAVGIGAVGIGSSMGDLERNRLTQTSLFAELPEPPDSAAIEVTTPLEALRKVHAEQLTRIEQARTTSPGFALLVAAESAAALAAVEMEQVGLPWRADVHDRVLTELLGERPRHGGRPPKLQQLAISIAEALDGVSPGRAGASAQLNPDSPIELLRAFRRQGVLLQTTRARELREIEHPAIEPLLRYKELARLHVAHGWAWRDQWVHEGRFRPEYVPGGVVSGRWATKGGGALQIPRSMRACVVADPGWALVVADAGQLEPRILAALSGDPGMIAATQDGDLYLALAKQALGRSEARDEAKIALLAAMYGARSNTPAMAALRRRFPGALELLEIAARTGEDGGVVRSALGRTCPPPSPGWQDGPDHVALARSRARGRFTRNFVIQASAADWANTLVAGLRRRLSALAIHADDHGDRPDLVFFQHDEVMVHTPAAQADAVIGAIRDSGAEATRLVVGARGVRIPLDGVRVASYADKR
jgi:DNA polymerase-1